MKDKNSLLLLIVAFVAACGGISVNNTTNNANSNAANANASPPVQTLRVIERPQRITELMADRGQQDEAKPVLRIVEPKAESTVSSSTVKVRLQLSGDLKGYKPMMDEATNTGNHIHVILDNQPYEAYYNLNQPFELRNVADGEHTLRVFPSRPWHESYKNEGAFQMVRFTVKGGEADTSQPVTTNTGQQMSTTNTGVKPTPEGKEMRNSVAGSVDPKKPLLTYSRPKGEYKGTDADAIMIDFWLTNAKLTGDGGEYRVRYTVDGDAKYIEKWEPIWLTGWTAGKHTIRLELVNHNGETVDNGGYNATMREITITK